MSENCVNWVISREASYTDEPSTTIPWRWNPAIGVGPKQVGEIPLNRNGAALLSERDMV